MRRGGVLDPEVRNEQPGSTASDPCFLAAFELSSTGLALVGSGARFVAVNPALQRMSGRPAPHLRGGDVGAIAHPLDVAALRRTCQDLLEGRADRATLDLRCWRADGTAGLARATLQVLPPTGDGARLLLAMEDPGAPVRSAADARASDAGDARFRAVVEQCPDGLVIVDRDGRIRLCNPSARRALGCTAGDPVGQTFPFLVAAGECREVRVPSRTEPARTVELRVTAMTLGDEPACLVSVRDVTDTARLREELRALSMIDELTRLYNRRGFFALAQQQLALADRTRRGVLLVFADLDGMKEINDGLGHGEGDRALIDVADLFREAFRRTDVVARLGGDEFAALTLESIESCTPLLEERLEHLVRERNAAADRPYRLSLSVGVSAYDPDHPCSIDELVARADQRMYAAKRRRPSGFRPRSDAPPPDADPPPPPPVTAPT